MPTGVETDWSSIESDFSLVLFSGPMAAGKSHVAECLLTRYGFDKIGSSAYLRAVAAERGLPTDRSVLQSLGDQLDQETDYRWIVDPVAIGAIKAKSDQKLWLVDAVRKTRQVDHFRSLFSSVRHVHIMAPEAILIERYISRQLQLDPRAGCEIVATNYEAAKLHSNETQARALIEIADEVYDTNEYSADQIAHSIAVGRGDNA